MNIKIILLIILTICILLSIFLKLLSSMKHYPKEYIKKKKIIISHKGNNYEDNYLKNKIPTNLDAIVIGSGLAGLITAAILSKIGKKVLVLEQNSCAGGQLGIIKSNEYKFNNNFHYITILDEWKNILKYSCFNKIKWSKIGKKNNNYIDQIYIGKHKFKFKSGINNYFNSLISYFPKEEKSIVKYFELITLCTTKNNPITYYRYMILKNKNSLARAISNFKSKEIQKYTKVTAYNIISTLIKDKFLTTILLSRFLNHGTHPKKITFFNHAVNIAAYYNGIYYPVGGTSEIIKNIITTIEMSGGRVLVNQGVKKIIVKNKSAVGITTKNNHNIYAKRIVSGTKIKNTYLKLLNKKNISNNMKHKLNNMNDSLNYIYIYIGMNHKNSNILTDDNIWYIPTNDINKSLTNFFKNPEKAPIPFFLSFQSTKDKKNNNTTCVIKCPLNNTAFKKYNNNEKFYKKFIHRIIWECLYAFYPVLKDTITYSKIIFKKNNAFSSTKSRYYDKNLQITTKTDINNLYITGNDILSIGSPHLGNLFSGIITVNDMLGYFDDPTLLIKDRLIFDDLDNI